MTVRSFSKSGRVGDGCVSNLQLKDPVLLLAVRDMHPKEILTRVAIPQPGESDTLARDRALKRRQPKHRHLLGSPQPKLFHGEGARLLRLLSP